MIKTVKLYKLGRWLTNHKRRPKLEFGRKNVIPWWELLCRATFQDLPMTQLHFSIVHRELGNSMGIISRKFQYLAAILQLEKTISLSDNWSVGNSTTDILST